MQQLLVQESCTGALSVTNPRFASNGEGIMQIPACAFQQMKIFRCTAKKAGLILSQELYPSQGQKVTAFHCSHPYKWFLTCSQGSSQDYYLQLPTVAKISPRPCCPFPDRWVSPPLCLRCFFRATTIFPYLWCKYILKTSRRQYQLESFPYPCPKSYGTAALSRKSLV